MHLFIFLDLTDKEQDELFKGIIPAVSLMAVVSTLVGHDATANLPTLTKASVSYQSFHILSNFSRKS